jgi:hypothetical protein
MSEKIFNRPNDNYVVTASRLRAGANNNNLRLSSANNETIIDLCNNGSVDISASAVFIQGLKVVTTSSGATTALTGLQLIQNLDVSGIISSDGGIQIGSGVFGGRITKSSNAYEIIIDPFGIDPSSNISDASGQVTIMGDLVVRGNTTTISSSYVDISDILLTLASGSGSTSSLGNGGGIQLGNGYASMLWNSENDIWNFNKGITINQNVSNNNSLILGGNIVTSNNSAQITNTFSSFTVVKGEGLSSNVGTTDKNIWTDANGWTVLRNFSSQYSYAKIEARIAYTSSPEVDQTLSFRMLKYSGTTLSYSIEVFTDLSLGSNMGVSINNVHSILFYDTSGINIGSVQYKLQFMRNCPTNSTITIPFGIQASNSNFISVQELYRPLV